MKLGELATRLGAELRGDAELEVTGVKGIEEAGPTEITFVANPRYAGLARKTRAAAVLVEPEFQEISAATLRIKNPYLAFSRALGSSTSRRLTRPAFTPRRSSIPSAEIGEGAHIGAYVVVGPHVRIGPHATLLPHVVLYSGVQAGSHLFAHAHAVVRENCILGDNVTLENGAIVGADGFGFAKNEAGHWEKIPQSGPVRLGDRVDVQANACIDRATVGATEIGDGTKVDNLVQVGHGSRVGENTLLCAQTGLAGSSVVGNNVILAGQTGIAGPLRGGRRSDPDSAIGRLARRAAGKDDLRLAGLRQSRLAARRRRLSAPAGAAQAPGSPGEEGCGPGLAGRRARRKREPGMKSRIGSHGWILAAIALPALMLVAGCHSYHVETTVENRTGAPIQLLEVDYPSASFGADSLAAGSLPLSHSIAGQRPYQVALHGQRRQPHPAFGAD
jgi:UDP-3-O-[3-hydroxymyristoyl] glucosamine N-acyltransferase